MGAKTIQDLELSFDVGHSSIGWAVLQSSAGVSPVTNTPRINILGCGVVTFGADDCLASKRRDYRRQRRHARATRQRIAQMEKLLAHLKILPADQLKQKHQQAGGASAPWLLAARVLAARTEEEKKSALLKNWDELWDVLRWYAHNRGYDGNQRWSNREVIQAFSAEGLHQNDKPTSEDENILIAAAEQADAAAGVQNDADSDVKKVKEAFKRMHDYGTQTMAETMAKHIARFEKEAAEHRQGNRAEKPTRFKGLGAAFPRRITRVVNGQRTLVGGVEWEVRFILRAHFGHLPNCDGIFERATCGSLPETKYDWRAYETNHPTLYLISKDEKLKLRELRIPGKADKQTKAEKKKARADFLRNKLVLPSHYEGGLLFGQAVPRFENRIISTCPITGKKVPSKNCPEFLKFRWAMTLANIRVAGSKEKELRPLVADERKQINAVMESEGALTPKELTKLVRETTGCTRDNLDTMLMHPDAKDGLLLNPIQKLVRGDKLKTLWPMFPFRVQKRVRDLWERGKPITLERICNIAQKLGESLADFEAELNKLADAANTKRAKKAGSFNRDALLKEPLTIKRSDGRAAYARPLLVRAYAEVMAGKHPKEDGGCLFITEKMRQTQLEKQIDQQTNNHLVRNRLLILERLLKDLIAEPAFANGDKSRIARTTIEVNRDLREMSGMSAQDIKKDLGRRLANHHGVATKLETELDGRTFNGKPIQITAGLIRKARIAEDLGWTCPYTGKTYDTIDLVSRQVDKDHIVPRSLRPSDSLDSLVITFAEVNKMKGQRTAWKFVSDEQGKVVEGAPQLSIVSLTRFKQWAESLETYKGHDDDKRRKKKRKELLLLPNYEEKGFVPRDLTITSQLVRLGAQIIKKTFAGSEKTPTVVSLPGSVTGTVRKGWNLLGCLELAAPQVKEADGSIKNKTDIRDLTHLHHALDACVLGLASHYLPNNGGLWEVMIKRNPNDGEKTLLRSTGYFDFDSQGRFGLTELPDALKEQIRQRLAEKRVVQHIPADMSGMRVEENTRGITAIKDGRVFLHQQSRDAKTGKVSVKPTDELVGKVVGLIPGKLTPQKGVRVITDNFGAAILDHAPKGEEKFIIIPWHKVWPRLQELKKRNGGKMPRILRNGQIIRVSGGTYKDNGAWKITSIKNQKTGIKLNLGQPDTVNTEEVVLNTARQKWERKVRNGCKHEASLASIVSGGLEILDLPLTGFPIRPDEAKEPKRQ